jgi:hypothetical protein
MNLVGRWRIETMDVWDRDAIDLVEPGFIEFGADGHLFFHLGDDSGFHAVPFDLAAGRAGR